MKDEELFKWLNLAIETEERGYACYEECLKNTNNPNAQNLFRYLVEQEEMHKNILANVLNESKEQDNVSTAQIAELKNVSMKNSMFSENPEKVKNEDLIEMFNNAMQLEKEGYELYLD